MWPRCMLLSYFCFLLFSSIYYLHKVNHRAGFLSFKQKMRDLNNSSKERDALCRCGWSDNKQQLQREKKGQKK